MLSALRKASMVFSGASIARPRWARTRGDAGEKNESSSDPRLLPRWLRIRSAAEGSTVPKVSFVSKEARTDALHGLGQLGRDDPELAGFALGDLGQREQVLVGQQEIGRAHV